MFERILTKITKEHKDHKEEKEKVVVSKLGRTTSR